MSFARLLDKYTAFYRFVKTAFTSRLAAGLDFKSSVFMQVSSSCLSLARQNTLPLEGLFFTISG
jgi:hypothetical protein